MAISETSKRNKKLDSIKGALILIVVLGHCIELTSNAGIIRIIYNLIYTFHMPLFVFITGYLTNLEKDKSSYFSGVLNIFLTYILFNIIRITLFSDNINVSTLLTPQWTLWYLLSVVLWRTAFYMLRFLSSTKLLVLCVIISIIGGYVPIGLLLSIQRTLFFSIFFALGYFVRNKNILPKLEKISNKAYYILFFIIAITFIFIIKDKNINWLLYGRYYYAEYPISNLYSPLIRIAHIIFSSTVSIIFIKLCPQNKTLTRIGEKSLFIYIYHGFIISLLTYIPLNYNNLTILLFSTTIIAFSLIIMNKISIFKILIEPYYNIRSSIIKLEKERTKS